MLPRPDELQTDANALLWNLNRHHSRRQFTVLFVSFQVLEDGLLLQFTIAFLVQHGQCNPMAEKQRIMSRVPGTLLLCYLLFCRVQLSQMILTTPDAFLIECNKVSSMFAPMIHSEFKYPLMTEPATKPYYSMIFSLQNCIKIVPVAQSAIYESSCQAYNLSSRVLKDFPVAAVEGCLRSRPPSPVHISEAEVTFKLLKIRETHIPCLFQTPQDLIEKSRARLGDWKHCGCPTSRSQGGLSQYSYI